MIWGNRPGRYSLSIKFVLFLFSYIFKTDWRKIIFANTYFPFDQMSINMITLFHFSVYKLTHLFPMNFFLPHENIRKPWGFLIFSGGTEKVPDSWKEWMKCTKLLSNSSTDFWGSVKCTKFAMDEMYKSANFLQSLNMNTAEFALSQL